MASVHILVGTVTGKALSAANTIADVLKTQHQVAVFVNPDIEHVKDEAVDVLIIVTSSTGQGALPTTIIPLYDQLQAQSPAIANKRFAVVALGDSSYDTFCQGGAIMESILFELQGQALRPRFNIDALKHYDPTDEARRWAKEMIQLF